MKPPEAVLPSKAGVVVAGSGAAGLTAALAAAAEGADVLLVERGEWLGGTTALSGGRVWVPGNHLQDSDTPGDAAAYLDGIFSDRYRHMTEVFISTAPEMSSAAAPTGSWPAPAIRTTTRLGRVRRSAAGPWTASPSTSTRSLR